MITACYETFKSVYNWYLSKVIDYTNAYYDDVFVVA